MKVLKGKLTETRYDFPQDLMTPPQVIKETPFGINQVTYMADELGLHKISNPDEENVAVSLHCKSLFYYSKSESHANNKSNKLIVYTPPNAAKFGCRIYDERTGKSSRVTQSNFYSAFGKRADK
jgi:cysteine dioxygenase